MTDPTADAAKLLPCPLEDIQILGPNTIGGDSWFGFPQTHGTDNRECTWKDDSGAARLILWFRTWNEAMAFSEGLRNTRPQPAPPDGSGESRGPRMIDTQKPFTTDEVGDLKWAFFGATGEDDELFQRLIATIEQQREQIEKLRSALKHSRDQLADERIGTVNYMEGSQIYADFRIAVALADEALAATEPQP